MSSSIAGSAAAAVTISPQLDIHSRSNNNLSNTNRFTSVNSFEVIHRAAMASPNNNETQAQTCQVSAKVVINIRGTIFETYETTLLRYPNTLLGSADKRSPYYDTKRKQCCFDRDKEAFDAILYYYQSSGKLIRPKDVNEETFLAELEFFQIDPWNVAELEYGSCNFRIPKYKKRKQSSESWKWNSELNLERKCTLLDIFLAWPCGLIVVLYMLATCISSVGEYQLIVPRSCDKGINTSTTTRDTTELLEANDHPLVVIYYISSLWFLFEFIFRFLRSEVKLKYIRSVYGVVDIISVLSIFSQILLREFDACQTTFLVRFANFVRTLSLLSIFKLARYSTGLRLFGLTVKACAGQLILSFYCVGICLLFFSSVIYYSEESVNHDFTSILDAFWYTMVTLTTVGYGDLVPVSLVGKMFGAICSVFGVTIVMAWPATIFVSYFTEIYNYEIGQKKKKNRKFWSRKIFKFRKGLISMDKKGCTFR